MGDTHFHSDNMRKMIGKKVLPILKTGIIKYLHNESDKRYTNLTSPFFLGFPFFTINHFEVSSIRENNLIHLNINQMIELSTPLQSN